MAQALEQSIEEKFKKYLVNAGLESKDYQVKGVEWCVEHEVRGYKLNDYTIKNQDKTITKISGEIIRGGIMADEMGLGKTIQMLGTIITNVKRHTLIVLPKALLDQWKNAIIKTLGHKPLIYHHFTKKQKPEMDEKLKFSPIVITTYGMVAQSIATNGMLTAAQSMVSGATKSPLNEMKWDRIIFDEAHHLRNNSTREYEGALKLKSPIKWMVTGTPIQNKISDLYSLLDILGVPKSYYKKKEHKAQAEQAQEHKAQAQEHIEQEHISQAQEHKAAEAEEEELKNLRTLTNEIILHRTKASVGLILPALSSASANIKWQTNEEKKIAEHIHGFLNASKEEDDDDDDNEPDDESFVLLKFLRARQMCILSALNKKKKSIGGTNSNINSNSKTDAVVAKIAERKENGKHKIVFCHFRGEIDFIKKMLTEKHKMEVKVIDGRTPEKERREILKAQTGAHAKQQEQEQEQAKQQEQEAKVLILQIQTGCEGLNLQEYSEVYFVSPHWNPAVEDQAVARCYRIGQKEETQVFRFYMNGFDEEDKMKSLDQYVTNKQISKKALVSKLLW
jgi:SNF2 family DNA or RNA helicase